MVFLPRAGWFGQCATWAGASSADWPAGTGIWLAGSRNMTEHCELDRLDYLLGQRDTQIVSLVNLLFCDVLC